MIHINDEGNIRAITIRDTNVALSTTTNKLYNVNGTLNFNRTELGSGGASLIKELSDAKSDSNSVYLGQDSGISDDGYNRNTAIGINSLYNNSTGYTNVTIRTRVLYYGTTDNNVGIGGKANYYNEEVPNNIIK